MIKILLLPTHTKNMQGGGIGRYNKSLMDLFADHPLINVKLLNLLPEESKIGFKFNDRVLREEIRHESPDIIHVNGYTTRILKQLHGICRELNIKIAYTPHWHPFNTMSLGWMKKFYFKIFIVPYLKNVGGIVSINLEEEKFLKKFSKKVKRIPHWYNGSDPNKFNVERIKNQICFVGRLNDSNKGIEHLLKLPENKYRICCIGKGDIPDKRDDMIQYTDVSEEELTKIYKESSLLVVPSRYEAFSYVTMEALCCGTPVVISERVRVKDFLGNDENVAVFSYGNYKDFIMKVEATIGKTVNPQKYLNFFAKDRAIESYEKFYRSIYDSAF